ncbi:MAG: hypothetical protein KF857_02965 [Fimbriimonadaceae bacterium]|nr:hypothetical protein [Fimbriimonadaceae bacterium]
MRVYFALAFGLVAGLSLASWQNGTGQSAPLPAKLTAPKLSGKAVAAVDEAFGNKGEVTSKNYLSPAAGVKSAAVYWEKGKAWSVVYQLEPKKELGSDWWKDAMKTVGLDPAQGKLDTTVSDDSVKRIESYPDLAGAITISQQPDEETGKMVVTVDWEVDTDEG